MKVYTVKTLQDVLKVGRNTALTIMQTAGFRIGYAARSPWRITEEQLKDYIMKEDKTNGRGV